MFVSDNKYCFQIQIQIQVYPSPQFFSSAIHLYPITHCSTIQKFISISISFTYEKTHEMDRCLANASQIFLKSSNYQRSVGNRFSTLNDYSSSCLELIKTRSHCCAGPTGINALQRSPLVHQQMHPSCLTHALPKTPINLTLSKFIIIASSGIQQMMSCNMNSIW